MAKAMGPFRDSQAPWISGPWTNVPAEPPLVGPAYIYWFQIYLTGLYLIVTDDLWPLIYIGLNYRSMFQSTDVI